MDKYLWRMLPSGRFEGGGHPFMPSQLPMRANMLILAALLLIGLSFDVAAQTRGSSSRLPSTQRLESVPGSIVDAARRDDERSRELVAEYLCQPLPNRDGAIIRGLSLMQEIDRLGARARSDEQTKKTLDQIREQAGRCACAALVINVSYDREFLPPRTTIGFDLQPSGAPLARGFTPIGTGDARLIGGNPVARPSSNPWIGDGTNGISGFSTPLPNGRWRVIVMTDKLGENVRAFPFGRMVAANRARIFIAEMPPERWLVQGYLTNKLVTPGLASTGTRGPGGLPLLSTADLLQEEGGAIEFEVDVTEGTLRLGFQRPASIAAIVVEPAQQRTSMPLVGEAINGPAIIDRCFEYTRQLDQYAPRRYLGQPPECCGPGDPTTPH